MKPWIFQYWDNGVESMPPLLRYIHDHNLYLSRKLNFEMVLFTKKTIRQYVKLPRFFNGLTPPLQSDIIRYHIIHKYGGIWLDSDALLLKSPAETIAKFKDSNYDMASNSDQLHLPATSKKHGIVQCAFVMGKPNTLCSKACMRYLSARKLKIAAIGLRLVSVAENKQRRPGLTTKLANIKFSYKKFSFLKVARYLERSYSVNRLELGPKLGFHVKHLYPDRFLLYDWSETKDGAHFVFWKNQPKLWLLNSEDAAAARAKTVFGNTFYSLTWNIYSDHNFQGRNPIATVFENKKSVFHHLMQLSKQQAQQAK